MEQFLRPARVRGLPEAQIQQVLDESAARAREGSAFGGRAGIVLGEVLLQRGHDQPAHRHPTRAGVPLGALEELPIRVTYVDRCSLSHPSKYLAMKTFICLRIADMVSGMAQPGGTHANGRPVVAGDGVAPPVPTSPADWADLAEHCARIAVEGVGVGVQPAETAVEPRSHGG